MSDSLHVPSVSLYPFLRCFHAGGVRAPCAKLLVAIFISCSPLKCVYVYAPQSRYIHVSHMLVDRQPTFNFCIYLLSMPYLRWRMMRGYPTVSRPPFVPCGRRRLMKLACCPPTPLLPDTGDRGSYGETGDLAAACAALKSVLCHGHRRGHA